MPSTSFKRKDTVVKAVRRNAVAHLDAVINALTGKDEDRLVVARRELGRMSSLLELVRRPIGAEVYRRERRTLARAMKTLAEPAETIDISMLKSLASAPPQINVDDLVEQLSVEADPPKPRKKKPGPDPKVLRLLADLAEMRMRARYWHLPRGEFEILAPGLRASYARVKKLSAASATQETGEAWGVLGDQLQAMERAWPAVLTPWRKEVRDAERQSRARAAFGQLARTFGDHETLRTRLDAELSALDQTATTIHARLLTESPAAFVKRLGVYWDVWRGVGG